MPRNYVRKSLRATCYTAEDLATAIQRVENKEMTMYAAAKEYKIPVATLHNRLHKKTGVKSSSLGRSPILPLEIETQLANGLKVLEKWGFGLSRKEVLSLVKEFVELNGLVTPFNNGTPGPDWFTNFRKRHRLSLKKAQPIEHVRRKNTDPFIVGEYFKLLQATLKKLDLEQKPERIWNLDETSVSLDPSKTKVVGQKGAPCSRTTHGTGKEHITVLTAVSAGGQKITPLIIFKGKYVWDSWMSDKADLNLSYAASKRGWMETEIFYNYMEKVFIPGLGTERPVLVVYDGHSTHVDLKVVELAQKHNITILKLPPHTSHLLQPLDVAVFKSFKSNWDAKLVEWQRHNVGVKLPKRVFSNLFLEVWNNTKSESIINGFSKTGIYPFDADVIPIDKYDPRAYTRWLEMHERENECQLPQPILQCIDNNSPLALVGFCIDVINRSMCEDKINDLEDSQSSNLPRIIPKTVHLLADVAKHEEQATPFVAHHESDLPACLRFSNQKLPITSAESKINIISNVKVNYPYSFEDLLLQKVQQSPRTNAETKRKRVALGAEVLLAQPLMPSKTKVENITQTENETGIVPQKKVKTKDENRTLRETNQSKNQVDRKEANKKDGCQERTVYLRKAKKRKTKKEIWSDTESCSSEIDFKAGDTDSEYENIEEYIEHCLKEQNDLENIEPDVNTPFGLSDIKFYDESSLHLKKEDWVVVKFTTKKSVKHFVGIISSLDHQNIPVVKFVRKVKQSKSETTFSYPIVEDICVIQSKADIICVLPQPVISRRGHIIFNVDLNSYNIQ